MKVWALPVGSFQANCYFIADEAGHAVVIDPGAEPERLLRCMRDSNWQVEAILLTHAHFDHISALKEVREATGAPVWCGAEEEPALRDSHLTLTERFAPNCHTRDWKADKVCRHQEIIETPHFRFTALHTPGHTSGGYCYILDRLLFTGDTLFAGTAGRTDLPNSSYAQLQQSLRMLAALDGEYTVYPGHGGSTTLLAEKRQNPFMMGISDL